MPQRFHSTTEQVRTQGREFVERIHYMRILGVGLCALPIASVLAERAAPDPYWILLAINVLVWPPASRALCRRARDPVAAEFRCLMLDSAFCAAWIAAIHVSAIPAAVFLTLLCADKLAAAGWGLLRRSILAMAAGFILAWAALGFPFQPVSSVRTMFATFPFLFVYSIALSMLTHRLGRRIREQNRELERISRTDPVMQLPNRPHFEHIAARELSRFRRGGSIASLLLIDVDHFKKINDRYGHGMGDLVLKSIAIVLRDNVREIDLPARYGGDEFVALLVDTDLAGARAVAERIREQVSLQVFDAEPGLTCSLSIGIAEASEELPTLDAWVQAADAALYRAKAGGRNQIVADRDRVGSRLQPASMK